MTVSIYSTLLTAIVLNSNGVTRYVIYTKEVTLHTNHLYSSVLPNNSSCDSVKQGYRCDPRISHFWGQYSPWFAAPSEIHLAPPKGCKVTFASVLSRHGARDPTQKKTDAYHALITSIQKDATAFPTGFEFLEHYNYTLGADDLTDFGRQEMINSGAHFAGRYSELLRNHKPFVRSAGQDRVVESAQMWLTGVGQTLQSPTRAIDVIIPEAETSNSTLSHDTCPAYSKDLGAAAQKAWVSSFVPPIQTRINKALGTNLTTDSVISLMDLCPYDTIANTRGTISDFCHLFNETEWRAYDYYQTLGKFYGYGPGSSLGATQGVGYVNELLARLTEKPVDDHTNTNRTLDSSNATFPLSRKVYADFSHDNDMSHIFAALGLYSDIKLSNSSVVAAKKTGYSAAWTVPFGARMYVEKLKCKGDEEEFVRVVLNDRVQSLGFCGGDKYGRCGLNRFVESQGFARRGGDWDKCYV